MLALIYQRKMQPSLTCRLSLFLVRCDLSVSRIIEQPIVIVGRCMSSHGLRCVKPCIRYQGTSQHLVLRDIDYSLGFRETPYQTVGCMSLQTKMITFLGF